MINPTMIKFTIMLLNSTGVFFDRFKDSWSGAKQRFHLPEESCYNYRNFTLLKDDRSPLSFLLSQHYIKAQIKMGVILILV